MTTLSSLAGINHTLEITCLKSHALASPQAPCEDERTAVVDSEQSKSAMCVELVCADDAKSYSGMSSMWV
jgi:hypothetical protein